MAYLLWAKEIHCPNCEYHGRAAAKRTGVAPWLVLFVHVLVASFFFYPLWLFVPFVLAYCLGKPVTLICPKCKCENPITQEQRPNQP